MPNVRRMDEYQESRRDRDRYQDYRDDYMQEQEERFNRERDESQWRQGPMYGAGRFERDRGERGYEYDNRESQSLPRGGRRRDDGRERRWQSEYSQEPYESPYYGNPRFEQTSDRYGTDRFRTGGYGQGAERYFENRPSFRGKGPRGYKRSDERLREDVCDRICDNADIDASDLEIKVKNGEVTLEGNVQSRHEKKIAEEIAEQVSGVNEVMNQIRVHAREKWSSSESRQSEGGNRSEHTRKAAQA